MNMSIDSSSALNILLQASLQSSILSLLVLAVVKLLGNYISAGWQAVLWAMPVIRFVCLVVPLSGLSLFQFSPLGFVASSQVQTPPLVLESSVVSSSAIEAPQLASFESNLYEGSAAIQSIADAAPVDVVSVLVEKPVGAWNVSALLLSVWFVGFAFCLSRFVWQRWKLQRVIQNSEPVTSSKILDLVDAQKREFRIRRKVRCVSSPAIATPATCGILSPVLFMPESLTSRLSSDEIRMLVAHELSHVKRFDFVLLVVSVIAKSIHWFNPFVYFATNQLGQSMECAADAATIQSLGQSKVALYVDLVLGIAKSEPPQPGLLTMAGLRKRLESRLGRLVTGPRPGKAGTAIAFSLFLLLAMTGMTSPQSAQQSDPPPTKSDSSAESVVAAVANDAVLVQENNAVESETQIAELDEELAPTASGVVHDAEGNPVSGVSVIHTSWVEQERFDKIVTTNTKGEFSIKFPLITREHEMHHLWAYKKGYPTRVVCVGAMIRKQGIAENVEIQLPAKVSFDYQILNADGSPFANQKVMIETAPVPNGVVAANEHTGLTSYVPKIISGNLNLVTDENGFLTIDSFTRRLVEGLIVENENIGKQEVPIYPKRTFSTLARTGAIRGQIFAKHPKAYAGTKIHISTDYNGETSITGSAILELDEEGKFEVPAIAIGRLRWVDVKWNRDLDIYPLILADNARLRAGETLVIESQKEPVRMIEVQGTVKTGDNDDPVAGATVLIRDASGRSNPSIKTDMGGNFSGRFAVGDLQVNIVSLGDDAVELHTNYSYPEAGKFTVQADAESPYTIPDLLLLPKVVVKGELLGKDGTPATNKVVLLSRGAFGHSDGRAKTDDEGKFEMKVSNRRLQSAYGYMYALLRKQDGYGNNGVHETLKVIRSDPEDLLLQIE